MLHPLSVGYRDGGGARSGGLPGDPVTDAEISDLKLLNRLDQIEDIVLDSAALTDDNIENILTVADQRKKELLAVQSDSPTWEGNLLEALETSTVIRRWYITDETAAHVLKILRKPEHAIDLAKAFERAQHDPGEPHNAPGQ